jgi:hypothetical protein
LVFLVVSFLLTCPPISYMHSYSPPFVLHAPPISFFLTWLGHVEHAWAKWMKYRVENFVFFFTTSKETPFNLRTRLRHNLYRQPYGRKIPGVCFNFPPAYKYRKYDLNWLLLLPNASVYFTSRRWIIFIPRVGAVLEFTDQPSDNRFLQDNQEADVFWD